MTDSILLEREGAISVITINRPEKRNAIDAEASARLNSAILEIESDASVAVTILTGAGDVFCAGADLKALTDGQLAAVNEAPPGGFGGLARARRRKPIIAAVNGHALAGGFELVLACDLAVALESAEFGLPEVTLGIIPGAGGLVRLPRQIPPKRALELILTGSRLPAREAFVLGLVNRLAGDRDEVMSEAFALGQAICVNAPVAVRAALMASQATIDSGTEAGWRATDAAWRDVLASDDAVEGPRAFVEKRAPRWRRH
jgi:enoyl-CoA hydratase/carnithine racemase